MRVLVITPWWKDTPWVQHQVAALRERHVVDVFVIPEGKGQPRWWVTLCAWWQGIVSMRNLFTYDVIHSYSAWPAGVTGRVMGWIQGVPHVVHEHLSPVTRLARLPHARAVLGDAYRVVAPSPKYAKELEHVAERPVTVVHNPVVFPSQIRVPQKRPTGRLVVGVGRAVHQKGWIRVVYAMQFMPKDVTLVLVGVGQRFLDAGPDDVLGTNNPFVPWDRVHFLPWSTHEEALGWVEAADLVVCPSRHESFGMVAAEARHLKKHVLATNVGAHAMHAHVIENTDDPKIWAHCMTVILSNANPYLPPQFHLDDIQFATRMTEVYEKVRISEQGA